KIVESAACAGRSNGRPFGVVSFALNRGSGDKKGAFVADILLGDTLGDRLRTFELRASVKVPAVLAAAKISAAFRTLTALADFDGIGHNSAAHGVTQNFLETRHLHPAGHIA